MEKLTTQKIAAAIQTGSRLVYQSDAEYRQARFIVPLNLDRLHYAICTETFMPEDFFILELVNKLCYVTPELLYFCIKRGVTNKEPECICIKEAGLLQSLTLLNSRMEKLANSGLLYCTEAKRLDEKAIRIYYISMEGFRAFTNRLEKRMNYDRNTVYRSITEMYRQIAVNTVMYSFSKNPYFEKMWPMSSFTLEGKKTSDDIYGRVAFKAPDSAKTVLAVLEPVYFRHDTKLIPEAEFVEKVEARLDVVEKIVQKLSNDETDVYVVFIVENGEGLQKLIDLAANRDVDFYLDQFFTTENAVFASSFSGGDGTDSLLGMSFNADKRVKFKQRDLPGIEVK